MKKNEKRRISRETLLRQLGSIPEAYILEAAELPSESPRRRHCLWRRICTSPAFAVCLGLVVAFAAITAILRAGQRGAGGSAPVTSGTRSSETAELSSTVSDRLPAPVPDEYTPQLGRIVRTVGKKYLFAAEEDGVLRKGDFAELSDGFGQSDVLPADLGTGDLVRVYGLFVLESYPARMPVYRVELVERGTLEQVNEETLAAIRSLNENGMGWEIETGNRTDSAES